jgi:hypothetical protein
MTAPDASAVIVGAPDVRLTALGEHRFEVATAARRFTVTADERQWESLRRAVTEIVPKLRRTLPLREQLAAEEMERLRPHLAQLATMGVLLRPGVPIDSAADLRLYAFIARRSTSADAIYAAVKRKPVQIAGDAEPAAAIRDVIAAQGLTLAGPGPGTGDAPPALSVAVSVGSQAALADANQRCCKDGLVLLPVLITARWARVGPWTVPGESACLRCLPPGDDAGGGAVAGAWLSGQPAFLHWLAGVVGHLALRAFVPMGADHPWGQVTTLEAATGEQASFRAWRDPYCEACARLAPVAQEWAEL